jgi:hypothetical protein
VVTGSPAFAGDDDGKFITCCRRYEREFAILPDTTHATGHVAMLTWLEQFLVRYPELALFLVIAAGYWIGSFKIGFVVLVIAG